MNFIHLLYHTAKLNNNQKKSREQIKALQLNNFRKILKHSYCKSEFYKEYYSSFGIKESDLESIELNNLPSIDKTIFIENFDRIVTDKRLKMKEIQNLTRDREHADDRYLGKYMLIHTSGTTGKPTFFVYDNYAWQTVLAAGFRACKGDFDIRSVYHKAFNGLRIAYIAATEGRFGGVMAASSGIKSFGFKQLLLNINTPLIEWGEIIKKFNPNVIIGYPTAIKILCDIVNEKNINLDVIRIVTGGEALTRDMRNYIQTILKSEVFNIYGASESIIIGIERDKDEGFYLYDDINILEIEEECVYLTSLYNFTQPLIRYKLSDKILNNPSKNDLRLPFTKVGEIVGRNEDIMWFVNENGNKDFLHPLIIDGIESEGIKKYQFIQKSEHEFSVNIEIESTCNVKDIVNKVEAQLNIILKQKNLKNLKYKINVVGHIPIDSKTGKSRLVIKEL